MCAALMQAEFHPVSITRLWLSLVLSLEGDGSDGVGQLMGGGDLKLDVFACLSAENLVSRNLRHHPG